MNNFYLTIHHSSRDEVIIQKSRFIGCAAPCETEEDALEFIRSVHDQYRDARHWCYAYVIGQNRGIMRYSDDGEPSGTAGMPMMDVIKNSGVVNCCVVVVRYFGGVLLGTGGLVRAYTQGCKLALQASGIIRMELTDVRECRVSYAAWNMIQHALQSFLHIGLHIVNRNDYRNLDHLPNSSCCALRLAFAQQNACIARKRPKYGR